MNDQDPKAAQVDAWDQLGDVMPRYDFGKAAALLRAVAGADVDGLMALHDKCVCDEADYVMSCGQSSDTT